MEQKKTIFDYIGQVFTTFGITIGILTVFCVLFGDEARTVSTIFSLGGEGIALRTILQFFITSVFITLLRFLFFTDTVIRRMAVPLRAGGMVASILLLLCGMNLLCNWFPVTMWRAWLMFFLSFAVSFIISVAVTTLRERLENLRMEEALERIIQESREQEQRSDTEEQAKGNGKELL